MKWFVFTLFGRVMNSNESSSSDWLFYCDLIVYKRQLNRCYPNNHFNQTLKTGYTPKFKTLNISIRALLIQYMTNSNSDALGSPIKRGKYLTC